MGIIKTLKGITPKFGKNCYVAEGACVIGDVTMGNDCSVWFNAVLRGDVHFIKIGNRVNIQDCCCLHTLSGKAPVIVFGDADLAAAAEDLTQLRRAPGRPGRVVASRSHMDAATQAWVERYRAAQSGDVELCSAGSSLKFCLLATHEADAYPRLAPTMEWDTAAGDAILRAAGGAVLRMEADGTAARPLVYNKPDLHNPYFLAAAPAD